MKYALAALGVALALSLGANAYQAVPAGSPSKPVWAQRVQQLLESTNAGQWQKACDAAPTAAYSYGDFLQLALYMGARSYKDLAKVCVKLLDGALSDLKGKPIGLTYKILYWDKAGKPATTADERLVVVRMKWNGPDQKEATVVFHVSLARIAWEGGKAKCKGKPCPELRWYVTSAT